MNYIDSINAAITVCDTQGIILYMNERSQEVFKSDGGKGLVGTSLFDCHPEPALSKVKELLRTGETNIYTIEKNGKKKIIYQTPWRDKNVVGGLMEMSFELPDEMHHFVRSTE